MKLPHRRFLHLGQVAAAVAVLSVTVTGHGVWSQTARTIKVVVPVQPGGGTDILARLLAEQIGRTQGLSMVIENRPGANNIIGTEAVSRAAPDGNTVLFISAAFVINPHLRKLSYDPLTSFEPICYLVRLQTVIVVNSASPYRTLDDLLNAARTKPGDLTLASAGPASGFHIGFEKLKRAANVDMTFVPYPGSAPVITALLGGHVTSALAEYPAVRDQLNAGQLRALATASRTRIELLPDVPTIAEASYRDAETEAWYGLTAPAKTPRETVSQLARWFTTAMQTPEVKSKLVDQGFLPVGICGADFGAFIRKQYDDYGRAIREANIKAE
jgi:tripartite-type tricarboxylate transporter receptor subunit TctC